jgi:YHS domain-containing protein
MPLTRLELRQTAVGDGGITKLARVEHLTDLVLTQTRVTNAAIDDLVKMKALKRVYVWGTAVTPDGARRLRQERPDLRVEAGDSPAAAPLAVEDPPKLTSGAPVPGTGEAAAPVNGTCPVSGSPVNVKYTIAYQGRIIGFCCPNCPAKFWAKPEDYLAKLPK